MSAKPHVGLKGRRVGELAFDFACPNRIRFIVRSGKLIAS